MEPNGILAVLLIFWLYLAFKVGFIGMALWVQYALPDFIERASEHYRKKPNRGMVIIGLLNGAAIPFVAILLISTGVLALPGLLLLLFYLWLAILGYTVVYRETGAKLFEEFNTNRDFKQTLFGGLVAEAAFLMPVLGQLYSLYLFIRSLGAVTLTILRRKR